MTFEAELERSGRLIYTNVGVSMMPLLRERRDIMVIEKLIGDPKRYDAVLFRRPGIVGRGEYVLHRVLKINGDGTYWIVGDNCSRGETVKRENILGVMTSVIRNGRQIRTDSLGYRLYVWLWCAPYPMRIAILRCRDALRRFGSGIIRWLRRLFGKN